MVAIIRLLLIIVLSLFIIFFGLSLTLYRPYNSYNMSYLVRLFSYISYIYGIKIKIRFRNHYNSFNNCIYIVNHQNTYDLIIVSHIIQPRTLLVGKKSLIWIPIFGILFWLNGNFFIERNNSSKSFITLNKIVRTIQEKNVSVCIFPEGTRSYNQNLLPFKIGAFYLAISSGIPIVPICISNTNNKIKLNRLLNGLVIVEILSPIFSKVNDLNRIQFLKKYCREIMQKSINKISFEANKR